MRRMMNGRLDTVINVWILGNIDGWKRTEG